MKNKLIWLGMILLIGIVGAGILANINPAVFTPSAPSERIRYEGNITFDCGGKQMSVHLNEPNMDIDDDFEQIVGVICTQEVTNVKDWTGREYKQVTINEITYRSFDEEKLNKLINSEPIEEPEPIEPKI